MEHHVSAAGRGAPRQRGGAALRALGAATVALSQRVRGRCAVGAHRLAPAGRSPPAKPSAPPAACARVLGLERVQGPCAYTKPYKSPILDTPGLKVVTVFTVPECPLACATPGSAPQLCSTRSMCPFFKPSDGKPGPEGILPSPGEPSASPQPGCSHGGIWWPISALDGFLGPALRGGRAPGRMVRGSTRMAYRC